MISMTTKQDEAHFLLPIPQFAGCIHLKDDPSLFFLASYLHPHSGWSTHFLHVLSLLSQLQLEPYQQIGRHEHGRQISGGTPCELVTARTRTFYLYFPVVS